MFFTDGDLDMDDSQKADLLSFVRDDGKGFIGIHSATITFVSWPDYGKMIGGYYDGHPWGVFDAPLVVEDAGFPGMEQPAPHFHPQGRDLPDQELLARQRARAAEPRREQGRPVEEGVCVARTRTSRSSGRSNYGKGRVLYNGLGHTEDVWDRPEIQKMWLEMVQWSMGIIPGDATPRPAPREVGSTAGRVCRVMSVTERPAILGREPSLSSG